MNHALLAALCFLSLTGTGILLRDWIKLSRIARRERELFRAEVDSFRNRIRAIEKARQAERDQAQRTPQ